MNNDITVPDIMTLDAEAIAEARKNRERLYSFLLDVHEHASRGFLLVSRGMFFDKAKQEWFPGNWEQSGFFSDSKTQRIYFMAADRPYQPFGFDDGAHFIPSDISRLLWRREFGYVAKPTPVKPPFTVEEIKIQQGQLLDEQQILDRLKAYHVQLEKDWEAALPVLGKLSQAQMALDAAKAPEGAVAAEQLAALQEAYNAAAAEVGPVKQDLLDNLKLGAIQNPVMDEYLTKLIDEYPEIGYDLAGADAEQLCRSILTWLKVQIRDREIKAGLSKKVIVSLDGVDVRERATKEIEKCLRYAADPEAEEMIRTTLAALRHAVPAIRDIIDAPETSTLQSRLNEILEALKK